MINSLLLDHEVPYALVISSATITQQSKDFLQKSKDVFQKDFTLIDSESPSSIISMIKEIKKGKSLLIYLDGNTGAGGRKVKEESISMVPFLDRNLAVRKGAAYLSHMAQVPIFAATCILQDYYHVNFDFSSSIIPDKITDREAYTQLTMQALYGYFAEIVRKYPQQWEAWFYLYRNLTAISGPEPGLSIRMPEKTHLFYQEKSLQFNLRKYGLLKGAAEFFLLDKYTFKSFPLEKEAFQLLFNCLVKNNDGVKWYDKTLVRQLVGLSLLVPE